MFQKIRIKKQVPNKELEKLFEKKEAIKTYLTLNDNTDEKYYEKKEELENVFEDIAEICAKDNKDTVKRYLGETDDGIDGFNQAKTWALKKKLSPKTKRLFDWKI